MLRRSLLIFFFIYSLRISYTHTVYVDLIYILKSVLRIQKTHDHKTMSAIIKLNNRELFTIFIIEEFSFK